MLCANIKSMHKYIYNIVQNVIFKIIRNFPPELSHNITLKLLKLQSSINGKIY